MRILFASVPAVGHFLPYWPLARAALASGHTVGLLTHGGLASFIAAELPGVQHVAAGPSAATVLEESHRRTGRDSLVPVIPPDLEGYNFGDLLVELGFPESIVAARDWRPDVIVADYADAVHPLVASVLGVPWYRFIVGPEQPRERTVAIEAAVVRHYAEQGVGKQRPVARIDVAPDALQEAGWEPGEPRLRLRTEPHTRPGSTWRQPDKDGRPRVLVSFGTLFNHPDALAAAVSMLDTDALDVVVATGGAVVDPGTGAARYAEFEPLSDLLDGVDVVVAVGGSGTVLGSMARGIPMVLAPQGADQPLNAGRVADAGAGVVVGSLADIGKGVADVLGDGRYHDAARRVADEIAALPSPEDVIAAITSLSRAPGW